MNLNYLFMCTNLFYLRIFVLLNKIKYEESTNN